MSTRTDPTKADNEVVLSWNVHLARQYPTKLAILAGLTAFVSIAAYWWIGALAVAAVAVVMIAGFADFVFPINYVLTHESALCRTKFKQSEIKWENVRHCYLDNLGVKLSPLDRQSRLEAFRGVYLRFADNRNDVIDAVKALRVKDAA
ncbi:hypothetical protein LLG46_07240 [bacterium]|nr:hypothetical protein [bacterium]